MLDVEALYRKYGPMVLRRCRSLLRDEDRALDAMQETFVRVLRRQEGLTAEAPSSLLYCIATNVCLNAIRAERRRPEISGGELLDQIAGCDDVEALGQARHLIEGVFAREEASTMSKGIYSWAEHESRNAAATTENGEQQ